MALLTSTCQGTAGWSLWAQTREAWPELEDKGWGLGGWGRNELAARHTLGPSWCRLQGASE